MKKIISLFKRDYEGNRQVVNEVVPGAEWVLAGEGVATLKMDGTACMVRDGVLYKRYDRKLTKGNARKLKKDKEFAPSIEHYKPAPDGWEPCEDAPNKHTGHWPGWVPIDFDAPEDKWHVDAWENAVGVPPDGTYELIGPKVQGNPYSMDAHRLVAHGQPFSTDPPRDFDGLRIWFDTHVQEGIVWHHPDGRMVKIKARDFGCQWPPR